MILLRADGIHPWEGVAQGDLGGMLTEAQREIVPSSDQVVESVGGWGTTIGAGRLAGKMERHRCLANRVRGDIGRGRIAIEVASKLRVHWRWTGGAIEEEKGSWGH